MAHSLICDVCNDPRGTRSLTLALDSDVVALDLCTTHAEEVYSLIYPLLDCGSRASMPMLPDLVRDVAVGKAPPYRAAAGVDLGKVRRWAIENGVPVADRGRIAANVINQYRASVSE